MSDVPGFAFVALRIEQLIVLAPAQHKAQVQGHEQAQPEGTRKALVKDMHHPSSPLRCTGEQQLGLFIALERSLHSSRAPPAHSRQERRSLLGAPTYQQEAYPLQARYADGFLRWRVVARFVMGQALGEASAHGTEPFELLTLRLLPHDFVPNRQALLSSLRPLLQLLAGALPQEASDELGRPFAGVQQVTEPFGAGWRFVRRLQIAA